MLCGHKAAVVLPLLGPRVPSRGADADVGCRGAVSRVGSSMALCARRWEGGRPDPRPAVVGS